MIILAHEQQKLERLTQWHRWFAWHPVKTLEGKWTWLRTVWRIALCLHWGYRREFTFLYRLSPPN